MNVGLIWSTIILVLVITYLVTKKYLFIIGAYAGNAALFAYLLEYELSVQIKLFACVIAVYSLYKIIRIALSDKNLRKKVLLILAHAVIVVVTAVLSFAGPLDYLLRKVKKDHASAIVEENRLKREALTITCEKSEFSGKRLIETYRIARLKEGCRYRLSGTAEISRSYGRLFDRTVFTTKRSSVDFVADSDVCHIALEYVIPDSEWDSRARYTRWKTLDLDEMERKKSYGVRKTTKGLVSIEKMEEKNNENT